MTWKKRSPAANRRRRLRREREAAWFFVLVQKVGLKRAELQVRLRMMFGSGLLPPIPVRASVRRRMLRRELFEDREFSRYCKEHYGD